MASEELTAADEPDAPSPVTYTTLSIQVRGRPPSTEGGDGDTGDDNGGPYGTIASGANPFSIIVTTNESSSATVAFAYGQGTTTFLDTDLPTYFTGAPTSVTVTSAAPNATLPFTVLTVGTVYWVQASGCGLTTAQQQFKRTQ